MFGDLDWPLNASRGFVSISWTSCNKLLTESYVYGDREYCLTVDDRLILCELQKVLQPDQSELVGSEQPHLSLLPLIITDVKHATKSVMCESESVDSLKVLIQQCLPYRTGRRRRRRRNLLCIGKTNNTNSDVTTSTKVLCRAARIAETITGRPFWATR